jgi:THO complex subunit 4
MSTYDKLSMSLDDVIKTSKKEKPQRGGHHGGGDRFSKPFRKEGGGERGGHQRGGDRFHDNKKKFQNNKFKQQRKGTPWDRDRNDNNGGNTNTIIRDNTRDNTRDRETNREQNNARADFGGTFRNRITRPSFDNKTKLKIENLHYNIVPQELNELFSTIGTLERCEIEWDTIGRSKGTAVVEYSDAKSASKAIQEYNGAELDGKILKVRYFDESDLKDQDQDGGNDNVPGIRKKIFKKKQF